MPKLLTNEEYYKVVTYKNDFQWTNLQIAEKLGISKRTVSAILKRYNDTGLPMPQIKGNKIKTKIARSLKTPQQIDRLRTLSQAEPFSTPRILKEELRLTCSLSTIKRRLRECNLKGHRAAIKEYLSAVAKKRRLEFAIDHLDFSWSNVVFTDEVKIETAAAGLRWVRRPTGYRFNEKYIREVNRHGRVTMCVWGGFAIDGYLNLVFIHGRLNSHSYLENILKERILPYKEEHDNMILVADNCPTHNAHICRDFLATHRIDTIKWPPQSPDINPIENVWRILKDEVGCLNDLKYNDHEKLIIRIKQAWSRIKQTRMESLRKMYRGMQRRLQAVIDAKGAQTKW